MKGAIGALRRGILAGAKFIFLAIFLSCGSMLVSFFVVQHLTRDAADEKALDAETLHRVRMLRLFGNELAGLCNRYSARVPADGSAISAANRLWIERGFRPDLQFLEHRMNDTIVGNLPELSGLRAAASRCAAMARNPADLGLRSRALQEVRRAIEGVEAYIAGLGSAVRAGPPREALRFGAD